MQQQTLCALLQDLEQELLRLGYTKGTMTFYRNRWRKLEDFADRSGQVYYTEQLGIDFVREYFGITQDDFSRTLNQAQTPLYQEPLLCTSKRSSFFEFALTHKGFTQINYDSNTYTTVNTFVPSFGAKRSDFCTLQRWFHIL